MVRLCKTCLYWSKDLKGTCKLTKKGVGQFWRCDRWEMSLLTAQIPEKVIWKSLPN